MDGAPIVVDAVPVSTESSSVPVVVSTTTVSTVGVTSALTAPPAAATTTTATTVATVSSTATTTATATPLRNPIHNLPMELQNDQKRRSSSRTIKRKRFDDEIVEYNITVPTNRGGADPSRRDRPRPSSQSYPALMGIPSSLNMHTAPVALPESPQAPGIVEGILPGTPSGTVAAVPAVTPTVEAPATPAPVVAQVHPKPAAERAPAAEKRSTLRAGRPANKRSQRRNGRPLAQMATKDLGRWKPCDDMALIIGIQQTNDLRLIHRGVKFSCKFTAQELQQRWYALLYEPAVSRIAVSAMRNLHPEMVESIQRKAPYSIQEEEMLGTISSTETPKLEHFQKLLDKNAGIFYCARTAKSLQNHWQLLKQYSLLPDQVVQPLHGLEQTLLSFSDAEEQVFENDINEARDEALEMEMALTDRRNKRDIRVLENELTRWGVLVDSVLGPTATLEFDSQTLACLCGRKVRYLMRSKEITFGRDAKDYLIDVDLSLEGVAAKISRRQGTIKLRSNGDFFIANEGKRAIFINGTPLLTGMKTRLADSCTMEMCGLRLTFQVNYELINAIRHESSKTANSLN